MHDALLVLAVFAACVVESVEALTIVLAVGLTRGWRSTMRGVVAGLVVLSVIVAAAGPAVDRVPIATLRLVIGGLLLVFGLGWLRKAILRASGFKALHDEAAIFSRQRAGAESAASEPRGLIGDAYAFTLAFKSVVLEGLEVVFIVVTFGANQHNVSLAAAGAAGAVIAVVAVGVAVRAPLARIPENTLKFGVGVLLTSFGMFWSVEGTGSAWPGGDFALVPVIALVSSSALCAVAVLRQAHRRRESARPATNSFEPLS